MSAEKNYELLYQENEQLKRDNEEMKKVIIQMRVTIDRMILRYITSSGSE